MTEKELQDIIGRISDKTCPECKSATFENNQGLVWCVDCPWSNDPKFSALLKSLESKP